MKLEVYKFDVFTLDSAKRTLFMEGVEIRLGNRDFEVLRFLLKNAPNLCSFDGIIEGVWGETSVENSSIEKAIANIRKALGDDARNPRFIKTVRSKGYHFVGDIQEIKESQTEVSVAQLENFESEKVEGKAQSQSAIHVQSIYPKKALLYLGIAFLAISGFLWWKGARLWTSMKTKTVLADDFSGKELDTSRWKIKGKSVKVTDGILKLSVDETDNPGTLRSEYFSVDPAKTITIESRIKITYSQNMKDKVYFAGLFGFIPKTINLEKSNILDRNEEAQSVFFGIRYMNYDNEGSFYIDIQEIKTEGFFLVKKGGLPHVKSHYAEGNISERIEPVWGKWFEQKIIFNPTNGQMTYFVDGEKKGEFTVDKLQAKDNQIRFEIVPWGWWVNHSIEMDYIKVTQ
jgi:DNA-binding winged helix-turn-helix (wHTH) protein